MISVITAEYAGAHRLRLHFSDGASGIADLGATLANDHREIFRRTRDREVFQRFRVDLDTVVWESGLDLAPEYLYDLAAPAGQRREPL